jgi:hypothetical protein
VREVALEVEELADLILIQISHFNMRVVHLCECRYGLEVCDLGVVHRRSALHNLDEVERVAAVHENEKR